MKIQTKFYPIDNLKAIFINVEEVDKALNAALKGLMIRDLKMEAKRGLMRMYL